MSRLPARVRSLEELLGYLAGVEHRVHEVETRTGEPSEERPNLERARSDLSAGRLEAAETALFAIDRRLPREEEMEMTDRPRGLVSYVPRGSKGSPVPRHEDWGANRLLLIQKLLTVQRAKQHDVSRLVTLLREADQAYADGDRDRAQALGDRVLDGLEALLRADRSAPARAADPTGRRES